MAEEAPAPTSIADRIAALKLNQVGPAALPARPGFVPKQDQSAVVVVHGRDNSQRRQPPPPPPARPELPARPDRARQGNGNANSLQSDHSESNNVPARPPLPSRTSQASLGPALPPRKTSAPPTPALPPRRPSDAPSTPGNLHNRRGSNESASSVATARSSLSGISNGTSITSSGGNNKIRAPEYDPASLPKLPPNRTKEQKEADARRYAGLRPLRQTKSSPKVDQVLVEESTPPPPVQTRSIVARPPALPNRNAPAQPTYQAIEPAPPPQPSRPAIAPPPRVRQSALSFGLNNATQTPPPLPGVRPGSVPQTNGAPPPVPMASKPDLAALQASKPKPNANRAQGQEIMELTPSNFDQPAPAPSTAPSPGSCLPCRDFSGPDNHAARFPRQSIPSTDVGWLANQLTAPFPSHTDKARAIFTWLHHNVAYDVVSYFRTGLKPSTPQSTIQTGLAVCEGYAGLFSALALKAGLECMVLSGASKGGPYQPMKPGDPMPTYKSDHAWNAVRIDNGEWKLIDSCWGAGNVDNNAQTFTKDFKPYWFTMTNQVFGYSHYPPDSVHQYLPPGTFCSWETYNLTPKYGCRPQHYDGCFQEEGMDWSSVQPNIEKIPLHAQAGPSVRFAFQKICPHYDPVRNGQGALYPYALQVEGLKDTGFGRDMIPLETNGEVWWADVPVRSLGSPGQKVRLMAITKLGGRSGRGISQAEYKRKATSEGFSSSFVCEWVMA
ncbi:uncharacterized protein K489DRAFT_362476 [Dissoconium aciculare CBS 342.82]|uniref:Transglutaminase-like domain-containing protein n=1 Tax=Dissoconium aciculare CBS 342.82 TaxID=1314786 RepID=A0A6J3LW34_9PEZI|nr:uncharacterized protein K489DRAFT_362476 [Dissoconium aciculare CBS 342.82]KAF1819883.1 hypothetical protein K489DRAFT_362476 [Dissoconium aciculare CBS 342.82]